MLRTTFMPTERSVIDTLRAAVESDPENVALRLHLASVFLENRMFEEALKDVQIVLAQEPSNTDALKQAADAAEKVGDLAKAASYRKLLNALTDTTEVVLKNRSRPKDEWADVLDEDDDSNRRPVAESGDDFSNLHDELIVDLEYPDLRLTDVAGLEKVKRRLNLAFLSPLKNPEMMKLYGKSLRGGLLLYGAPGCGKTFIAKAVAGELGARFISVGLADVLDMWIGSSEKNVHSIFEHARRNSPCVLFFDELDALGRKRSLTRNSNHGAINQLLSELDGM